MTTDSPRPRNRDEIERDRKSAIATGALWYLDTAGLVWRAEGPERLIADVGPLLERLDQLERENAKLSWRKIRTRQNMELAAKDAELDGLRERLDQAERERDEVKRLAAPWSDDRGYWQRVATRLCEARKALVNTGYFGAAQVGDDIAPRITEYANAAQREITELHLRIEGMSAEARLHEDSRDRLVTERNALHAGLSAARERLDQQTAEIERLRCENAGNAHGLRYWNRRYVETEQQAAVDLAARDRARSELAAAQARAESAERAGGNVAAISAMISGSYPPGLDAEAHMWRRHQKVANEAAEVLDAIEGAIGENPRKGVTKTWADVDKELLDAANAALGAYEHNHGNDGSSIAALFAHIEAVRDRLSSALGDAARPLPEPEQP